jgi:hypothetical protein
VAVTALADWRRDVAGFTLAGAARAAGITQSHAAAIEARPDRAALGTVAIYVRALGGDVNVELSIGGTRHQLDV